MNNSGDNEADGKTEYVNMEGIFTHFTKADEKDKSFTKKQIQEFVWMTERLKEKNVRFTYEHCSNSAASLMSRRRISIL